MSGWKQAAARYVTEARALLEKNGYPTEWDKLKTKQPETRLLGLAVQVVAATEYLAVEIERGRTERALDRYHAVVVAFEEMDTLARHPELIETAVTTTKFHKNLRKGILTNQGADRGRANRSRRATQQELVAAIDREYQAHPRLGITVIREIVGSQFGITGRYVCKLTKAYNPKKV